MMCGCLEGAIFPFPERAGRRCHRPQGSLWMFRRVRDSIPRRPRGRILGRSQTWGQCPLPKPLGHRATRPDTEEGHSCCTRRLECKSGQGCLWKLARHLWTLLQWRYNAMRLDSDLWSLPPLTILCWWTLLVVTKHSEDGPGIAQMDSTTTRMIKF